VGILASRDRKRYWGVKVLLKKIEKKKVLKRASSVEKVREKK